MTQPDELYSWVALHALPGMGPVIFQRLIRRFGSATSVMQNAQPDVLAGVRGVTSDIARAIADSETTMQWARRTTDDLRRRGVRLLRLTDAQYPQPLLDLAAPPPLLYMVGDLTPSDARAVSIVGSTKPSPKGRAIASRFAARLAAERVTIVSGYAHGVDAAAHRGAYSGDGRSILCVPYGIRRFKSRPDFPPLAEIAQRGAVISECPPDQEWSAAAAVARNRIIAALGRVVFVIETRTRGGTMHTVKAAESLGRPLFALKYTQPPDSARGNAVLIARGATALTMVNEIGKILDALPKDTSGAST